MIDSLVCNGTHEYGLGGVSCQGYLDSLCVFVIEATKLVLVGTAVMVS